MRRTTITFAASAAVLPCVLALAACGSSGTSSASGGSSPSATSSVSSASTAGSPASSAAAGSGSNAGLTMAQFQSRVDSAAKAATALHISGSMDADGSSATINVQLNKDSSQGTLTSGGVTIPFIYVGGTTYVQLTSALLEGQSVSTSSGQGKAMLDKWVSSKTTFGKTMSSGLSTFDSISAFVSQISTDPGEKVIADGTTTLKGQTVAVYKDDDPQGGDTELFLPLSGPALPIEESGSGSNAGTVTFTWNQPTGISAPKASQIYTGS